MWYRKKEETPIENNDNEKSIGESCMTWSMLSLENTEHSTHSII